MRSRSSPASTSTPTSTPKRNSTPSAASWLEPPLDDRFSILKSGTPKRTSPPPASSRSNTVTAWPARFSCCAHASPAGPGADHRDACARCACAGGCGTIQPSSQARFDDRDLDLLDRDGVALADLEHARGLARRRAEPAGELGEVVRAVELRRSPRASGRGRRGRSSPGSGCRAGSRWWQNGTPHSMQRAPCARSSTTGSVPTNSR